MRLTSSFLYNAIFSARLFLLAVGCILMCHQMAYPQWSQREYHPTPISVRDSAITVFHRAESFSKRLVVESRVAMSGIKERAGMAPAYWGFNVAGRNDTLVVTIRHGNTDFGDLLDQRFTRIQVTRGKKMLFSQDYMDGFATSSGSFNTMILELDREDGRMSLSGGDHSVVLIAEIPYKTDNLADMRVDVWAKGEMCLSSLSSEVWHSAESRLATGWTIDDLNEYFSRSADPVEGYWRYLDRQNDPQYARLGGRYVLAVVKNEMSGGYYDVIYISGAETMAGRWTPGMLKGNLYPTVFQFHYDLCWYDSTFEPITRDIHASVTDNAILTLSFPLLKATLRFSKASYHKESQAD